MQEICQKDRLCSVVGRIVKVMMMVVVVVVVIAIGAVVVAIL
jgi:hypothetical protein